MSQKRKDNRGRLLHNGEIQLSNGRYRYKYVDYTGEEHCVYSWRLDRNDPTPQGKRPSTPLRELEKQIQADAFDHIVSNGGNYTVLELVEKYVETKTGSRRTTKAGYKTVINLLKRDSFGSKRIDTIHLSDAKLWLIKLQKNGKSYSSIHSIRGVLRPAFQMAMDDDLIRKNPFQFQLIDVIVNDSVRRDALSREQERNFLRFVKEDCHFCRYYDGMYILFNTGLRISEFCGLTISDIDFDNHCIFVRRQLQKDGSRGYYIEAPKTSCGERILPMSPEVEKCFKNLIANRYSPKVEPMVDGITGFLHFDKNGSISYSLHWNHHFTAAVEKHNKIYKNELPKITPHICRHTYCTKMGNSGMNPKTLQYLMGHADIGVTLNTYTHVKYEDAVVEVTKLGVV